VTEDGKVVVLVPRFDGPLGRWVTRRLSRPHYRVRLDSMGTAVWNACDGTRTVGQIVQELRHRHGTEVEPAEQRVVTFVRRLERGRCIRFAERGT